MASRWGGAMLLEAENPFRGVKGYREMAIPVQALRGTAAEKVAA